jgi:hypothetical protein
VPVNAPFTVRRLIVAAGLTGTVLAGSGAGAGAGAASAAGSGAATADVVRLSVTAPGASLSDKVVDLGGPTARARLDEVAGNDGFAAYPHPGDAVLSAGLAAGATGVPLPSYPLVAAATYPATPEAKVEYPGYALSARAGADEAAATARSGAAGEAVVAAADATTTVRREAGAVTAVATATADAVRLGPLQLTALRSEATVTRAANGEVRRRSDFTARLSVGDTTVRLGNGGVVVAGSEVPVAGVEPLTAALDQAGLSLEYLQAHDTDDGVVSAGLVVKSVRPVEGVGTGVVTTTMTVGRTAVSAGRTAPVGGELGELPVESGDAPGAPSAGTAGPGPAGPGPASADLAPAAGRAGAGPADRSTSGAALGSGAGALLSPSGGTASGATAEGGGHSSAADSPGAEQTPRPEVETAAAGTGRPGVPGRFRSVYPLLAAAGVVTVVGQHGIRILVQRGLG